MTSDSFTFTSINLSYRSVWTQQYHEFDFTDWRAALEFAKLVGRSGGAELLTLKAEES